MTAALYRHLRAWYAAQALPQPDGSFLVRPFWPGAAVFALPDAAARERFASVRALCHLLHAAALLGAMLLAVRPPLRFALLGSGAYVAIPLLITLVAWWRDRHALRGARRVPPEGWTGPRLIDPHAVYPRWLWWLLLPTGLGLAALGVPRLWARFSAPDTLALTVLAGTLAGLALALRAVWALTAAPPPPSRRA